MAAEKETKKVGIVGSGLVGKSWAMIFASVGFEVSLYDVDSKQLKKSLTEIHDQLDKYEKDGVLRGTLSAEEQKKKIVASSSLKDCVKDTAYVQECVPESLDLKRSVWADIEAGVTSDSTVLASSTSCILPSDISAKLLRRSQFMVAHPVNPPYFLLMVELVPAPWTSLDIRKSARAIMSRIGQIPVSLNREVPGFLVNRLQYPVINEAWSLVADEVVSAEDLDVVMKEGLGMRYAVLGPMETIHLNADGVYNYCERYGQTVYNISQTLAPVPTAWTLKSDADKAQATKIRQQLEELYPLEKLNERRARRDEYLMTLAKAKKLME